MTDTGFSHSTTDNNKHTLKELTSEVAELLNITIKIIIKAF